MVVRYRLALILLSIAGLTAGCRSPCGGVSGSCMVIELDSAENFDALELKLRVKDPIDGTERIVQPSGGALLRVGRSDKIRLLPPPGVDSAQITAISLLARRESGECFQYSHTATDWPSGTTQSLTATFQIPPRITGLTPTQGPTSGGTQVDLAGENFIEGMEVLWGSAAPVHPQIQNPRTARTQSLAVPAWTPGQPTKVAVRDPAGCQTNEAAQGFQQYAVDMIFNHTLIPIGKGISLYPFDVQMGMLDDDSLPDIAVVSRIGAGTGNDGYVTIAYSSTSQAGVSFSSGCVLKIGQDPTSLALGKFNKIQKQPKDIAIIYSDSSAGVDIINNQSNFRSNCPLQVMPENVSVSAGGVPYSLASAKINNDDVDDLGFSREGGKDFTYLVSKMTGGFKADDINLGLTGGAHRRRVNVYDFDRDGKNEFVVADYAEPKIHILKSSIDQVSGQATIVEDGSIDLPPPLAIDPRVIDVVIRPVAGSQQFEMLLARSYSPPLYQVRCNGSCGSGTSLAEFKADMITVNNQNVYLATGDLNGDGYTDIAISNSADGTIWIALSDEKGQLSPLISQAHTTGCNHTRMISGDVDGDQKLDLIVAATGCSGGGVLIVRNMSK